MSLGYYTLLDLANIEAGLAGPIIEEGVADAPELRTLPAETISGDTVTLTVRTDLPEVQFRNLNEGAPRSKGKFITRIFSTAILNQQGIVDIELLRSKKPAAQGRLLESHMAGVFEASVIHIGSQFYYGISNDKKGFPGIIAQMDPARELSAGGAANFSSVWFVSAGPERLHFIFGNDRTITVDEEWVKETIYDAENNPYQALTNWMRGNIGLRLANQLAAFRIKEIDDTAEKGVTDDLLYEGLRLFKKKNRLRPTHVIMNGRSLEQLRKSRQATNDDGRPVPLPTTWNNIPILETESITEDESI